jgi:hypothetical protein
VPGRFDHRLVAVILVLMATSLPAAGFEIRGTLVDEGGQPIAGALVVIAQTAGSVEEPWCEPDCGKHTLSDRNGRFTLRTVHSLWLFHLHVEAPGFTPRVVLAGARQGDPAAANIILVRADHPNRRTVGQVLLPDGSPAKGALVTPRVAEPLTSSTASFQMGEATTADDAGRFAIESEQALRWLEVRVTQPGAMDRRLFRLVPGGQENVLQLSAGATVSGRLLHQGLPAAGVKLAMTPAELPRYRVTLDSPRLVIGAYEATSDAQGCFVFRNVHPEMAFRLYTRMHSLAARNLAAIDREVYSPADGGAIEIGEVNLHPAHTLRGRLIVQDLKQPISGAAVVLERVDTLDSQIVPVDADGRFEVRGLPSGAVALGLEARGLRLSPHNPGRDPTNPISLAGRVREDLSIAVLVEPKEAPRRVSHRYYYWADWRPERVGGDMSEIFDRPLMGLPPEMAERLLNPETPPR